MVSSNYFSSSSFDFNETRIVLINCYVPIIIKFDTTFYICNNTMTAPKRPAPKRPAPKCPRAQMAAPKRRRPEVTYPQKVVAEEHIRCYRTFKEPRLSSAV